MKAVRIHKFGGPEVLTIDDVPVPEPKSGEALVRVGAASVNPVDYKIRSGKFPPVREKDLPITLGRDLAGKVDKCGTDSGLKEGSDIIAMLGWDRGSYAEYVIVRDGEAATKPDRLSDEEGAAIPLAGLTAWQGLFDHGGLEKGQRVLIHGGAGGVGHFAIQFARWKGANIAATASHKDLDFVRTLGAQEAIDYKNERFEEKVHDVDLVFDLVGGETQARSLAVLKPGGILVSTLQAPDKEKLRQHGVRGTNYMAKPNSAELADICRLISMGKVNPVISGRFPLEEAAKAQTELEHGHVIGKIVLDCRV